MVLDTEPTPDRSYNYEELPWREESFDLVRDFGGTSRLFYTDLYAALRQGAPLAVTPESVRRQVALLDRCRELSPI